MSPSALSRLLRPVEPLTPAMSISDVADRLLMPEHRAFLSLPVVDDERRVLGLVSRYTLQDIFMQRFGRDLWGRHPVRDVMNRAPSASPSAPAWKRRRSRSPVACSIRSPRTSPWSTKRAATVAWAPCSTC